MTTICISTAPALDATIAAATANYNNIPRLVFAAATSSEPVLYSGHGGWARLPSIPYRLAEEGEPIQADSIFELYSCTKLVGSIAALQLVKKGLIGLDNDAARYVPELSEVKVLVGFDEQDEPLPEEKNGVVTVRMLLTHTSGFVYWFHDIPSYMKLCQKLGVGESPYGEKATPKWLYKMPLFAQPGSRWIYGTSIDWLTKIVENLSKLSLEEYLQQNIFGPLSITVDRWRSGRTRSYPKTGPRSSDFGKWRPRGVQLERLRRDSSALSMLKELIKVKGFQVPPAELEGTLLECPFVADVAVIGVWVEEDATEYPRAYVVLSAEGKSKRESITAIHPWTKGKVAHYQQLKGCLKLVETIPKSPAGKILRRILRDEVKKEQASEEAARQGAKL